jgi:hypothetical protein
MQVIINLVLFDEFFDPCNKIIRLGSRIWVYIHCNFVKVEAMSHSMANQQLHLTSAFFMAS